MIFSAMTPGPAVTFAAPWIAWAGVAAASGPVLLHLLNRRRYRPTPWAAMRFLMEARRRNRRKLMLEDLILLLLRCAAILLISLAVARPRAAVDLAGPAGGAADTWFVLDDSASMGAAAGSEAAFAAALEQLGATLADGDRRDRVAIYRTSDRGEPWLPLGRPADREALGRRIASLAVTDTRAGLAETLAAVAGELSGSDEHKRVVVISDFRRVDLADEAGAALRAALAKTDDLADRLILLDVGRPARRNLTIESVRLLDRHAVASLPARLAVTVRNTGLSPVAGAHMTIRVGEAALPVTELPALAAGDRRDVEVPCAFPEAVPTVVEVRLPPDALAADNAACLVVDVRDAVNVLIVDGAPDPSNPPAGEAFYLQAALDPGADGRSGVRPEVIDVEHLGGVELDACDLVVLAGVGELPGEVDDDGRFVYPIVDALGRYVADGGAVAIFTGERVNVSFYNDVLYAGGAGLAPYRIAPAVGQVDGESFVRFRADSVAPSPMLANAFGGELAVLCQLFKFYRYTPAFEQPAAGPTGQAGEPRVLMRFDDERGSPAIVERRFGDGRVMMTYSSAGAAWNDWCKSTNHTYLPVMNDMVAHLARRRGVADCNGPVGRPIDHALPAAVGAAATLKTPAFPDVDLQTLTLNAVDGRVTAAYADTRWAGVYEVAYTNTAGQPGSLRLGRSVEAAEGDLDKATPAEVAAAAPAGATYVNRGGAADADGAAPMREYWRWLLLAAVVVLAGETVLARRFGHYPPDGREGGAA